jgi:hypothetical protein
MTSRRGRGQQDGESAGRRTRLRAAGSSGEPPVREAVRSAELTTLPVAFAGRQAAGVG